MYDKATESEEKLTSVAFMYFCFLFSWRPNIICFKISIPAELGKEGELCATVYKKSAVNYFKNKYTQS